MLGICSRSNLRMRNLYMECECSDLSHTVRWCLDENDGELWLEFHLRYAVPWYKRVLNAVKYAFGIRPEWGHYDITMIKSEDRDAIIALLEESKRLTEKAAQKESE